MGNQGEEIEAQQCTLFVLTLGNKALVTSITMSITAFVLVINAMMIYGIIATTKTKNNHYRALTKTQRLFVLMSVTDITTIITFTAKGVTDEYGRQIPCSLVIALICFLDATSTMSSLLLFILSTLRYLAIRNPFLVISTRAVRYSCIVSTVFSLSYGGVLFYTYNFLMSSEDFQKMMCLVSFSLFLFIDVVLVINTMSYLQLVKSPTPTTAGNSETNSNTNDNGNDRAAGAPVPNVSDERKRKAVKTLFLISCIYSFCNTPLPIYMLIELYKGTIL